MSKVQIEKGKQKMLNNYANITENKKLTITNYKLRANIEGVINYN